MLWYILGGVLVPLLGLALWEFRVRRPDQLVLHDARGEVRARVSRLYPRHFSLCLPYTVQTVVTEVEAEAKGRLGVRVQIMATAGPDPRRLTQLIRVGGWNRDAVSRACEELELILQSLVRAYTERKELEDITGEDLVRFVRSAVAKEAEGLGLQIVSIAVRSIEPTDRDIAEMIQQREAARIRKQTEIVNQQARVTAAKAKLDADERIARTEHELQLKKLELRKEEEQREAELAKFRLLQEIEERKAQLDLERQEIELLAKNPEVLLLTPQVARLAEASQGLRNARTIVTLSPNSLPDNSPLARNLLNLLERALSRISAEGNGKGKAGGA